MTSGSQLPPSSSQAPLQSVGGGQLLDTLPIVIWQADVEGQIIFLNGYWQKITGRSAGSSLGWNFLQAVPLEECDRCRSQWQAACQASQPFTINLKLCSSDGTLQPFLIRGEPLQSEHQAQKIGWVGIFQLQVPEVERSTLNPFDRVDDSTDLQRAEANLQVQANQLIKLNAELTRTTAQLEKRNQELDQFAYVASHDLKAPLRAIANLSEWIEEDLEEKLVGNTRDQMTLLRNRVLRMENLINGLLSYSRVGRCTEANRIIDVAQLIAEVADSLAIPEAFDIRIDESLPTFVTQLLPLQQVFTHLISNAVKHHDQDQGVIEITAQDQGKYYQFKVTDDGPGIAPQYHNKVFSIFQTLRARDSFESTGIGLSIVRKIVEAQGGTISISSHLGAGTTFCFNWFKSNLDK